MVSFALGITLFLLGFLALNPAAHSGWRAQLFSHISVLEHMGEFSRGIIDSRRLMFYLGLTVFFLFLTVRVVESRRWK
jgi:ABC-2 type transport system permease protein